jgi:hypothetical protein
MVRRHVKVRVQRCSDLLVELVLRLLLQIRQHRWPLWSPLRRPTSLALATCPPCLAIAAWPSGPACVHTSEELDDDRESVTLSPLLLSASLSVSMGRANVRSIEPLPNKRRRWHSCQNNVKLRRLHE